MFNTALSIKPIAAKTQPLFSGMDPMGINPVEIFFLKLIHFIPITLMN